MASNFQGREATARGATTARHSRSVFLSWFLSCAAGLTWVVGIATVGSFGCSNDLSPFSTSLDTDTGARSPFAPREMRITPLTHVDRAGGEVANGPAGDNARTLIIFHLEFVDRWYDTCKAFGKVELELYRPGGGLNPGVDVRTARWEIDLTNLDRNAEWFDPVTRTYRVQLDTPAEVERTKGWSLRVRAVYTPAAGGGVLQDEFVLRG